MTSTPIVQIADSSNNPAYAYTHWKAIAGKPEIEDPLKVISPNGTVYKIVVDDDGKLTTEKEVSDGSTNNNVEQSGSKS